jgi:hypothetical protein
MYPSHRQHDEGIKLEHQKQSDKRSFIPGSPSIDARLDLEAEGPISFWEISFFQSLALRVTRVFTAKASAKTRGVSKKMHVRKEGHENFISE